MAMRLIQPYSAARLTLLAAMIATVAQLAMVQPAPDDEPLEVHATGPSEAAP